MRGQQLYTAAPVASAERAVSRCRVSYDALPPALQDCFCDFAAYPEDWRVPGHEIVALWAAKVPLPDAAAETRARHLLGELEARSMVLRDHNGCYVHDVMREVARAACGESCVFMPATDLHEWPAPPAPAPARSLILSGATTLLRSCTRGASGVPARRLSVHSNFLHSLPAAWVLRTLCVLHLERNNFCELPPALAQCSMLRVLSLAINDQLETLLDTIGELRMLNSLVLRRCDSLRTLPDSVGDLAQLQNLDLS